MEPGDVRTFDGPGGERVLIFVDETYDIDGTYASALWRANGCPPERLTELAS